MARRPKRSANNPVASMTDGQVLIAGIILIIVIAGMFVGGLLWAIDTKTKPATMTDYTSCVQISGSHQRDACAAKYPGQRY